MAKIIYFILCLTTLISLFANPAPVSIEFEDVLLIILPFSLAMLSLTAIRHYKMQSTETNLFIAVDLYLTYLIISMLIGLMHGVSLLNVLRSVGPYLNFFPILLIALLPAQFVKITYISIILISVGFLQGIYLFYLYFTHANDVTNTIGVLINRITLLDPHTTLPLILSVVMLPLAFIPQTQWKLKLLTVGLFVFGILAGSATLTRSLIISIFLGSFVFMVLYVYYQAQVTQRRFLPIFTKNLLHLIYFIPIILLLTAIPKVHMLEQGLFARFLNHSASGASVDYTNGRLFDEWLPALSTWIDSGVLGWFFGIGAGNAFTVTSGEERTYIHNLSIYSLVYGGLFGLFSCLWLYFTIFKTLVIRAFHTRQMTYLSFAALLVSIFVYGQFFAVHKGLAFNLMLYIIIALAFIQPTENISLSKRGSTCAE